MVCLQSTIQINSRSHNLTRELVYDHNNKVSMWQTRLISPLEEVNLFLEIVFGNLTSYWKRWPHLLGSYCWHRKFVNIWKINLQNYVLICILQISNRYSSLNRFMQTQPCGFFTIYTSPHPWGSDQWLHLYLHPWGSEEWLQPLAKPLEQQPMKRVEGSPNEEGTFKYMKIIPRWLAVAYSFSCGVEYHTLSHMTCGGQVET